jgi:opacity protein-like surface antigen
MRRLFVGLCLAVVVLSSGQASAQQGVDPFLKSAPPGPPESGVSIGLSLGYGVPIGNVSGSAPVSNLFSGTMPLQLDVGWRFTPSLYLGAYFQYGFAFLASNLNSTCSQGGVSCSGSDMQFGLDFIYTFMPYSKILPYVGLGAGWEIASVNVSGGNSSASVTVSGFQFARLIVGTDFRLGSSFRLGPFVNFSLAQFSSLSSPDASVTLGSKTVHSWLQFGLKGTVDL